MNRLLQDLLESASDSIQRTTSLGLTTKHCWQALRFYFKLAEANTIVSCDESSTEDNLLTICKLGFHSRCHFVLKLSCKKALVLSKESNVAASL